MLHFSGRLDAVQHRASALIKAVAQGVTGCPATRHPGQVPRFVMGFNKPWDASRDPEYAGMTVFGLCNVRTTNQAVLKNRK